MGKPVKCEHLTLEREATQRTETSKYLQEKKTKVIPSVAASERGVAQTRRPRLLGL